MPEEIKFLELNTKDGSKKISIKFTSIDVVQDEGRTAMIFVGTYIFEVHKSPELISLFHLDVIR